ncbi:hypothetical protein SDC9_122423 [bioreactor metagenome]|uniref:Uncharacterized protein n=1 Tax=bioreactor metagenome TaxID=1076179 RepID=A0A645CET7_9ZZZZ
MKDRNSILNCGFCRHTLNTLNNNTFSFFVCRHFSLFHNLVDVRLSVGLGLFLHGFNQTLPGFIGRKSRNCFQLFNRLAINLLQLSTFLVQQFLLILQINTKSVNLVSFFTQLFLPLIQRHLSLFQPVFGNLYFRCTCIGLLFSFGLHRNNFLFSFQ